MANFPLPVVSRQSITGGFGRHTRWPDNGRMGRGFSQIELLVVIGVIAILLAILFPAYRMVINRTDQVGCVSNLRTLGMAAHIYANDHDGYLPPGYRVPRGGVFDRILSPYVTPLVSNQQSAEVFYCPANLALGTYDHARLRNIGTYGFAGYLQNYLMNASILRITSHDPTSSTYVADEDAQVRLWSVAHPAQTVLLMDMRPRQSGGPPSSGLARNTYFNPNHAQWILGTIHNGRGNILFVDGSVSSFPREPLPVMSLPDQQVPWF